MDKYNTRVRQAISDEFVKCSKEREKLHKEFTEACIRLDKEKNTLSYKEYNNLKHRAKYLRKTMEELSVELDTWDKAREICLNAADGNL